ncbi:stage II sporulation protein P [Peribacillus sp. Hz7]|uniref:stage II sporulation protein P n=1 Tax=Peribacillus sp. Hz7 TaxID=3344873 RepID=UPI0035C986D4
MQNNKDLFDLIKKAYPLNPRADFVSNTEAKLRQAARKLNRTRNLKRLSVVSSGLILCVIVILSILSFSGKGGINNTQSSPNEINSSSAANKQKPLIFIYHSHNHESFIPEIEVKESKDASHESKNITLVGERLSQKLKEKNINNVRDHRDIMGILEKKELPFNYSYSVSRESLKDTLGNNNSIRMVFDIHRNSEKRNATTIKIKGTDYARIEFVISRSSKNYDKNMKFAKLLHNKIEEKYPDLSRGIVIKSKSNLNEQSTYNQDLFDNSALLYIGGVENSLEEEYRTADAFAEIIEEILHLEK